MFGETRWCLVLLWLLGMALGKSVELKPDMHVDLSEVGDYQRKAHSHQSVLDPDGVFTVYWTPDLVKQEVVWELHVRTLGWFGFGFSSNGNMRGADIMTAWVSDGQLFLQDRHGIGAARPPLDDHADWRPLHARENDTHTILVVARDINTCDPQDFLLTNDTVRLIYAWDDLDPIDNAGPNYHSQKRGNRFALVLLPFHRREISSDVQTWNVRQKMTIPNKQDTFYWCHVEKVPKWKTKQHYVGFDMIYGQNSRAHLHHAVAFECSTPDGSPTREMFEKYVGHPGYECYTPNMPPDFYQCEKFLINWAIGSEGEILPEHVGYPLGDLHGGSDYLLFQTHYDNQPLYSDITVEWGMNIYYTDKLRKYDASNMALGHSIVFSLSVPPRTSQWLVAGHCSSECTAKAIPEDGINVFLVFLHGHYLARAIRLRHFRGNMELKPIAVDSFFDPDFQQSRQLPQEVKVLPGDHLTVECDFDSRGRANVTTSGWSAVHEMCQAFINYYPRIDMALCRSSVLPSLLGDTFGIKGFSKDIDLYDFVLDTEVEGGRSYQEVVNGLPWASLDKPALNRKIIQGGQAIKCQYDTKKRLKLNTTTTGYPRAKPYVSPEDTTCSLKIPSGAPRQDWSYTYTLSLDQSGRQQRKETEQTESGGTMVASSVTVVIASSFIAMLFSLLLINRFL